MRHQYFVLFLGCIGLVISAVLINDENAVRDNTVLASGYNHLTRPAATTEVKIGISLTSIDELKWIDERLAWDPTTYGGINSVFVSRNHIWKPELALDSLFEDLTANDDSSNVRYDYTGKVVWQQRRHFKLYCKIRKDYCPLEEQTCRFDVVGSSYNISEVRLGFLATAIDTKYIREAEDFEIIETGNVSSTVVVTVDDETLFEYPKLEFWITIKRGNDECFTVYFLPLLFTTMLMGFTFIVPMNVAEKLTYISSLYLSQIFVVQMMSDAMPQDYLRHNHLESLPLWSMAFAYEVILFTVVIHWFKFKNIKSSDPKSTNSFAKMGYVAAFILRSPLREKMRQALKNRIHPSLSSAVVSGSDEAQITTSSNTRRSKINEGTFNDESINICRSSSEKIKTNAATSNNTGHSTLTKDSKTEHSTIQKQILKDAASLIETLAFFVYAIEFIIYLLYYFFNVNGLFFHDKD